MDVAQKTLCTPPDTATGSRPHQQHPYPEVATQLLKQQEQEQAAGPEQRLAAAVPCYMDAAFLAAVRTAYQADPKTHAVVQQLAAGVSIPPRVPGGKRWVLQDGLLYLGKDDQKRLYLPADERLWWQVFDEFHNAKHSGAWRTHETIRKHYLWAGMKPWVYQRCRACSVCQALPPWSFVEPFPPLVTSRPAWDAASVGLLTQPPTPPSSSNSGGGDGGVHGGSRSSSRSAAQAALSGKHVEGADVLLVEGCGVFEAQPGSEGLPGVALIPRRVYQSWVLRSLTTCMA